MAEAKIGLETLLSRAIELERTYDWIAAAAVYQELVTSVSEADPIRKGAVEEGLAYAYYRSAFQSDNPEEYRGRLDSAKSHYLKAKDEYAKASATNAQPFLSRCNGMIARAEAWRVTSADDRRKPLFRAWQSTLEALDGFDALEDFHEYLRTCNMLMSSLVDWIDVAEGSEVSDQISMKMLELDERAIALCVKERDNYELARAYVRAAINLESLALGVVESGSQRKELRQRARERWKRGRELCEESAIIEETKCFVTLGMMAPFGYSIDEYLDFLKNALETRRRTKDRVVIGSTLESLGAFAMHKVSTIEDTDERYACADAALAYATAAQKEFSTLSLVSTAVVGAWSGEPHLHYYAILSLHESDLEKKRYLAKKAAEVSTGALQLVNSLGYPDMISKINNILVSILTQSGKMEPNVKNKREFFIKATEQARIALRIQDEINPKLYWNRGNVLFMLAEAERELAEVTEDSNAKTEMLLQAVKDGKEALEMFRREFSSLLEQSQTDHGFVGFFRYDCATWLLRLHNLTKQIEHLEEAARAFEEAVESFQIADTPSRCAESYWKAASTYDALGDHLKSSARYANAAESYRTASKRLPKLGDFYDDFSKYMESWAEIEKARYHHARQEPGLSKEHYEKAAHLHESTMKWSYLAKNYLAWSELENAEDLSRKEKCQEALHSFEKAAGFFGGSKDSIQSQLGRIENPDEVRTASVLIEAAGLRFDYCKSRALLEEARALDKTGDGHAASEKYGKAAEKFEKIFQALDAEQDKDEMQLIATLARAWQAMARAEDEASPGLYGEAATLFEQAKDLSPVEASRLAALGHSRFCRALEAGTKFSDTGDANLHVTATQHLESAANYYMKAGLRKASDYAKASKLLFDGYIYTGKANREDDQAKKARMYAMAEKVFQASASSYEKADQPKKKEQVLKLLEKAGEEKALAVTLAEVLIAPDDMSATTAFSVPTPTHEKATGVENFEHANVQATLAAKPKELHVGQELSLEIELVNAGRGPAQLTKVEATFPRSFVVVQEPEKYRMEDSQINLRGRRLDALKTEDVRLVLKPTTKGKFKLEPRIMYLDESGAHKSCEPTPINVSVKEMGITGWMKGV